MQFSQGNQQFRLHLCIFYLCWSEWRVWNSLRSGAERPHCEERLQAGDETGRHRPAASFHVLRPDRGWGEPHVQSKHSVCRSQRSRWATSIDKSRLIRGAVRAGRGPGGLLRVLPLWRVHRAAGVRLPAAAPFWRLLWLPRLLGERQLSRHPPSRLVREHGRAQAAHSKRSEVMASVNLTSPPKRVTEISRAFFLFLYFD